MKDLLQFGVTKKRLDASVAIKTNNSKTSANLAIFNAKNLVQTSIDLGQKGLGPSKCIHCGTVYSKGLIRDEKIHTNKCKKRFNIGRRTDILRKVSLYKPSEIDDIITDCFEFAFVRPCEHFSDFVKKIMCIAQSDSQEPFTKSMSSVLTPMHRLAVCIGTDESPSLRFSTSSKTGNSTLYAVACIRKLNNASTLTQLETFWIHPMCVEVTLQTDIFRGVVEVLKMNAIYGYSLTDQDIFFGNIAAPV